MSTNIEFHKFCLIFPQATEHEIEEMANDIFKNGLKEAIVRHEGKILDGRNRYLACQKAGVEPHYTDYDGNDPLGFVVSKNLYPRAMAKIRWAIMCAC